METPRPVWNHKTPEDIARWLLSHSVTAITLHREMTGNETSEEWLELHDDPSTIFSWGKKAERVSLRVPVDFLGTRWDHTTEVIFAPDHRHLVEVKDALRKTADAIDAWEEKNQRDRAEFERLKLKFGGAS
ncbi:MAG TPA: hypothetical protein VIL88_17790 [Devosia sp.]|jgi:hypothetical protein|uniref:hypothetical protein n=1 Tax=Devosia sp. TaxID=1871048 RepID=UPI002F9287AA